MKIKKGQLRFSKGDTMQMDGVLNDIIAGALKKFKKVIEKQQFGVPQSIMTKKYPEHDFKEPYSALQIKTGFNLWLSMIDEMIEAFSDDSIYPSEKTKKGRMLFVEYYDNLWW